MFFRGECCFFVGGAPLTGSILEGVDLSLVVGKLIVSLRDGNSIRPNNVAQYRMVGTVIRGLDFGGGTSPNVVSLTDGGDCVASYNTVLLDVAAASSGRALSITKPCKRDAFCTCGTRVAAYAAAISTRTPAKPRQVGTVRAFNEGVEAARSITKRNFGTERANAYHKEVLKEDRLGRISDYTVREMHG